MLRLTKWALIPLVAFALALFVALRPGPANAQRRSAFATRVYAFPPIGFVEGQTLRVTVAFPPNPVHPPDPGLAANPVRILLYDGTGAEVGDSGRFYLPAVQHEWFDFERSDIALTGEDRTGRVQLRAVVFVENAEPLEYVPSPGPPGVPNPGQPDNPVSVEIVDTETGKTQLAFDTPKSWKIAQQ